MHYVVEIHIFVWIVYTCVHKLSWRMSMYSPHQTLDPQPPCTCES